MSTRAVIVVTGKAAPLRNTTHTTVRLYKHTDGCPSGNLPVILKAVERAENLAFRHRISVGVEDIPAETMADLIIAASVGWYGATAKIDTDHPGKSVYPSKVRKWHFGLQGDVEWCYLVDAEKKVLKIYSGSPENKRLADPMSSLEEDDETRFNLSVVVDKILEHGWTINPRRKK